MFPPITKLTISQNESCESGLRQRGGLTRDLQKSKTKIWILCCQVRQRGGLTRNHPRSRTKIWMFGCQFPHSRPTSSGGEHHQKSKTKIWSFCCQLRRADRNHQKSRTKIWGFCCQFPHSRPTSACGTDHEKSKTKIWIFCCQLRRWWRADPNTIKNLEPRYGVFVVQFPHSRPTSACGGHHEKSKTKIWIFCCQLRRWWRADPNTIKNLEPRYGVFVVNSAILVPLLPVEQEVIAVASLFLTGKASTSAEALRRCLDMMQWWARMELDVHHPEETAVMHDWMDHVLCM